jgi:hypothetical protein
MRHYPTKQPKRDLHNVVRWQRNEWRDPQSGRIIAEQQISLVAPRRGEGWQRVVVDVTTSNLIYHSCEAW